MRSRSLKKRVLEEKRGIKTVVSYNFSLKLSRKRKFLTIQGDFCKIIDVGRTELCFLTVEMGNPSCKVLFYKQLHIQKVTLER